jgi:hypothetical protein
VAKSAKTNKPQKAGILAGKKRGGQPGNRNAARSVPNLSHRIRDLTRRINAALRAGNALIAGRAQKTRPSRDAASEGVTP